MTIPCRMRMVGKFYVIEDGKERLLIETARISISEDRLHVRITDPSGKMSGLTTGSYHLQLIPNDSKEHTINYEFTLDVINLPSALITGLKALGLVTSSS